MDQRSVRSNNLSLVFRELLERGPRSRASLAKDTGLNKTTVSSLVAELIDRGLLMETETERSTRVGRPGLIVDVNGERLLGLGLEISGDYVAVCLKDLFGRVLAERYEMTRNREASPELLARRLGALAREVLTQWLADDVFLVGACVAVPGLVAQDGVTLLVAPQLGLERAPIGRLVSEELDAHAVAGTRGLRVTIEKDANLGALAEGREGAGRDLSHYVYISGGAGISAGIIVDGELVRGAEGFAGEIGHFAVERDGPRCACGARGCFEAVVRESLVRLVGDERLESSPSETMNEIRDRVALRMRAGDPEASAALAELSERVGTGLSAVVNLLNPQAVILGGWFSGLSEWLLEGAEAEMRKRLAARDSTDVHLRVAVLGGYAPLRGAAIDALSHLLEDPRLPTALEGRRTGAPPARSGGVGAGLPALGRRA